MADRVPNPVKYQSIHSIVLAAFPQTRLDNMSLLAGCERWQDGIKVVHGSGMYSEIKYSGFDVCRDAGLRVLHKRIQEIVRAREEEQRGNANIDVEDVYNARDDLCLARTIELADPDK